MGITSDLAQGVSQHKNKSIPGFTSRYGVDRLVWFEAHLAPNRWMLGAEFSLVDCAYCPIFNVVEKAGFSFTGSPNVGGYLDRLRARPAWQQTPRLPGL